MTSFGAMFSLVKRKRRRRRVLGFILGLGLALSILFHEFYTPRQVNHSRQLQNHVDAKLKILYTITSLAEYNTGSRATVKGSDRLKETLIPVMAESVHSMLKSGFDVDVFLVAHYTLRPERLQLLRESLPPSVNFRYWEDAMPLGYDVGHFDNQTSKIGERSLALARQHRFVIRDNLFDYDVFVNFEDDMLIKGEQIQHYLKVTNEIEQLKRNAPQDLTSTPNNAAFYSSSYYGPMTKGQLSRMIPGFIRVEVQLEPKSTFATKSSPVPVDFVFNGNETRTIDPAPCCHVAEERSSAKRPSSPASNQVMLWETEILPLGVRKMPQSAGLDWVALLRGPTYDKETPANAMIGDYWAGNDGYFEKQRRPGGNARNMINNQGGWMATRGQIWDWHTKTCPGGFLPPYDDPHFRFDGLDLRDVEWWSGGLHLVTKRHACNLQRIVSIDPDHFHLHLLYHTANNKQSSLASTRFTRANDLLGQLNTVRKNAEKAMQSKNSRARI